MDRLWTFEAGQTSTSPNPVYTYSVYDTTYVVSLAVTDSHGCKDTVYDSVYVKPAFHFTFTHDTVCFGYLMHFHPVDLALGDSLYSPLWDFGDPNSGPNNISHNFNTNMSSCVVTTVTTVWTASFAPFRSMPCRSRIFHPASSCATV